jgi:hypothetical protein
MVDQVDILDAVYDPGSHLLSIEAASSDEVDPPALVAVGIPGTFVSSTPGIGAFSTVLTYNITGAVPPAAVTVESSHGGQATKILAAVDGGTFAAGAPVAVDDFVEVEAGLSPIDIPVLANDSTQTGTISIVTAASRGTTSSLAGGIVRYTPANTAFVGDDTFTYTVRTTLTSNVASVTVTTTPSASGPAPIASNDSGFSVRVSTALTIPVNTLLANDSANGGSINPASFALSGAPTGGTTVVNLDGAGQPLSVTFTAGATAGPASFRYTIASNTGVVSAPAIVSIDVLPAGDTLTIAAARYRIGKKRWDINGTATVVGPSNIVTLKLVRNGVEIATITTTPVAAVGGWVVQILNSNVAAQQGDIVRAASTAGGAAALTVNVTQ